MREKRTPDKTSESKSKMGCCNWRVEREFQPVLPPSISLLHLFSSPVSSLMCTPSFSTRLCYLSLLLPLLFLRLSYRISHCLSIPLLFFFIILILSLSLCLSLPPPPPTSLSLFSLLLSTSVLLFCCCSFFFKSMTNFHS